jgi:5''-methylthioadenosine/S-adenosylhomocysteine nucleosidase
MQYRKIGIIGAMDIEVDALKAEMTEKKETRKAGMVFCEGLLCGFPAVVVRCGVGKVNSAMCAQILIDLYDVDAIINSGIAGSLDAEIDILDVVIATDLVQHDMDVQAMGYTPGQIPSMDTYSFKADEALSKLVADTNRRVNPDLKVFFRRIVSGDQFVADSAVKARIKTLFDNPGCTEMEGAAMAQAAYLNGVPFAVVRAISDKADDSAEMDYPSFEKKAAEHSIRLMEALMSELAKG